MEKQATPVKLFISYASEDVALCKELLKHLGPLRNQKLVSTWYNRQIAPGNDSQQEINKQLEDALIILLLISSDFLDSEYNYGVEMKRALERHNTGEARVTLTRFWRVREEKFGTIEPSCFYWQISTNLHARIQATSCSFI